MPSKPKQMSDREFESFLELANAELDGKQSALERKFHLSKHASWAYDQETGLLTFKDKSGNPVLEAATTDLGTFTIKTGTWCWAWADDSVSETQQSKAQKLTRLAAITGYDIFEQPTLKVDDAMAWELAAMCVHHLNSLGCYRGASKNLDVFLSIDSIKPLK